MSKKTNFDQYVAKAIKQQPELKKELEKASRALKAKVDVVVVPEERIKQDQKYLPRPVFGLPAFG